MTTGRRAVAPVSVLVALAYVPLLLAAPGRMPADSKLYLYLDPGRLLSDTPTTFDPRQFAGWVPHQHISYLWPAGPWYWLFDTLGVPDWIAHRLWVGTLLVAAGLGVRWCAGKLGLSAPAALAAALVYQLSPYLLPYVSRTSVMLLPWAGLGWIVGLTVRASRRGEDAHGWARWGDPAAIALVVLTVGAVNATALAMIVPAPLLWLVHATWLRDLHWRTAVAVAARTAALAAGVSAWWVAMLMVQGRDGADVLPYSESLADVSFTATATEVWRSLGYWLFYVRDRFGPTTTAALPYLSSTVGLVISFAVPVLALGALACVRWRHRRFAALLVGAGLVLAIGVHPIDDRSPLMRLVTGDGDDGLALALRSSTRALPMAVLGMGLALGAAVQASGRWRVRRLALPGDVLAAAVVALVAVVNLPALWTGDLVDPALTRDQEPPAAWTDAADTLDDPTARVLQVPGLEFGAFRWGYTVDQPLPGLVDTPLVTRDLLPLGSAAAMDLLYALDDRIQDGTLEPASVAPIARLLGAADVWLTNDAAYERFDVTAPATVARWLDAAEGLAAPREYGEPVADVPTVEMNDARTLGAPTDPAPAVALYPVEGSPTVSRAVSGSIVVSGSGDGLVDAAAAGLLDPDAAIVYSAATDDLAGALDASSGLLVTDSNRARARHWRSSQDATGFTESAGRDGAPATELTAPATGDARLPVFGAADDAVDPATQTTAEQRGPVIARADRYGQPFVLQPERRPFMAVDGDPGTAWVVGDHGDPRGATLDLTLVDPTRLPTAVTLSQFTEFPSQRTISAVSLRAWDADGRQLGDTLAITGDHAALDLDPATTRLTLTIDAVTGGAPGTEGIVAGVGFTEVSLGLAPTVEVVRPPSDALAVVAADTPVTLAFTRLRSDPADRWRSDPEPTLVREFELPEPRQFSVAATVRLDARADEADLAELLGWPAAASTRLAGRLDHAGVAAIDGDPTTAWITGFDAAHGATLTIDAVSAAVTEIVVVQPPTGYTAITEITLTSGTDQRVVSLTPDADGRAVGVVEPALAPGDITLTVSATEPAYTLDRRFGDQFELPAAIAEIELAGLPALPDYASPTALTGCVDLASLGDEPIRAALTTGDHAAGTPAWLAPTELVALACVPELGPTVALTAGVHLLTATSTALPIDLDRVVLAEPFDVVADPPAVTITERSRRERTLHVDGCPDGCWVILGEGYSTAWEASVDGRSLGAPTLLDGGFTGWWVAADAAATGTFDVQARWTSQGPVTVGLAVSALAAAIAVALVVVDVRRRIPDGGLDPVPPPVLDTGAGEPLGGRAVAVIGALWVVAGFALAGPVGLLGGALGTAVLAVVRRRGLPELTALATVAVLAVVITFEERRLAPLPDGGWPYAFEQYHRLGAFAVACLLVGAVVADDDRPGSVPSAP